MFAPERSGETEAIILIKAAPQVGHRHGETVCCAGMDLHGNWLRMYPVSFRHLDDGQKFGRWDRVRFKWRMADNDPRIESRRIDQQSLEIIGQLHKSEREKFLASSIVSSLEKEREKGRSLALIRPRIIRFFHEKKSAETIEEERVKFERLHKQADLFNAKPLIPYKPSPYIFKYTYETDDGERTGTCQDWEMEATFYFWEKRYGEKTALDNMLKTFGEDYPRKGMVLAMGTHSQYPDTWLINGVIRLDEIQQLSLF